MHRAARSVVWGLAALLAGCATNPPEVSEWAANGPLATPVELTSVPFFPQKKAECGPASLAMALDAAGSRVTPGRLVPEVYLPKRKGSLAPEMRAAVWRDGRVPYVLDPSLHALLTEVAAGHPVIVLENLAFDWYPDWHYAVVVGFNLSRGVVVLRSGQQARHVIPVSLLEHTWARAKRWAMVVLAPGELPATGEPERYARAVYGLERLHPGARAQAAWTAGVRRWPDSLSLRLGDGNAHYAAHAYQAAAADFTAAVSQHPDSVFAWNNLAMARWHLGQSQAAVAAARRAVALAGADRAAYLATLKTVQGVRPFRQ